MKALAVVALSVTVAAQAVTPPRDTPAAREATATVKGRVTAAATRNPLHRVRVTLQGGASPTPLVGVSDTTGLYEIPNVPTGAYVVRAVRAGYLATSYGERRPREAGRRVQVKTGETIDGIDFALQRGGVLGGIILDELGEPAIGAKVEALEFRYLRGRRVLLQAGSAIADDRGGYRISGLQPGSYFVRASTTDTWLVDDGKTLHAHAVTLYPGVTGAEQAQHVALEPGQEIAALDFRLHQGRAALVTGRIENAAAEPMPAQAISLSRIIRGVGGGLFASAGSGVPAARSDANGAFAFAGVAPGEYVVSSGGEAERVSETVVLGDGDARHVILTPRRAAAVSGTVITDEDQPPPFNPALVQVDPIAADPESLLPTWDAPRAITVGRDWAFRLPSVNGQYLLRLRGLPDEWMLAAIRLNGRDTVDAPVALKAGDADIKGLQMVVSRAGGQLEGRVRNADGTPASDATVLVFSTTAARWTLASRFVRAARLGPDGNFVVAGLPAGVYHAVALEYIEDGQWEDPELLARLVKSAIKVELVAGESQTAFLKLERVP